MSTIFQVTSYFLCAFCIVFCLIFMTYVLDKQVRYLIAKHKYGKTEGTIINKYKELGVRVGPVPPYDYYFEIEKETNGEKITRKIMVSEFEYEKYEIGDKILKESFKVMKKI